MLYLISFIAGYLSDRLLKFLAVIPAGIFATVKQQKHLSLSFAIEIKKYYSRHIESNTSSSARTVQLAKT